MTKKKPAKRKTRYLEFGKPVVNARPPGATPADLIRALGAVALGQSLPAGWDVEQPYRNSPTAADWKQEPVEQMVQRSARRGGDFVGIWLNRVLKRKARQYGISLRSPRRATPQEIEDDEEIVEREAEREAPEFEALAKQKKRSAAARKGWVTRRAAAAKKRPPRAKKGNR